MKNCSNNSIALIGAGIASCGFAAAFNPKHNTRNTHTFDSNNHDTLASRDHDRETNHWVIFEKARGLGGRMSNFRTETGFIELGAQFITATQPSFAEFIGKCQSLNLLQTVKTVPFIGSIQTPAWCAQQRFSSIHKHFLQDFQIHLRTRIVALDLESGRIHAEITLPYAKKSAANEEYHPNSQNRIQQQSLGPFGQIILAVPAPQALALIPKAQQSAFTALAQVEYWPCWVFVIKLKNSYRSVEPHPKHFADVLASDSIQWLQFAENDQTHDDLRNNDNSHEPAVIIVQMSHPWSEAHQEQTASELYPKVFDVLESLQLTPDAILRSHFWRYAKPKNCIHRPFISTPGLSYIGDACLGGRVESAFMSGYAYGLHCLGY